MCTTRNIMTAIRITNGIPERQIYVSLVQFSSDLITRNAASPICFAAFISSCQYGWFSCKSGAHFVEGQRANSSFFFKAKHPSTENQAL